MRPMLKHSHSFKRNSLTPCSRGLNHKSRAKTSKSNCCLKNGCNYDLLTRISRVMPASVEYSIVRYNHKDFALSTVNMSGKPKWHGPQIRALARAAMRF